MFNSFIQTPALGCAQHWECKKVCNNAICSNTDGPRAYHTEYNKSKTNIIWYHLYGEYKKMI